MKEAERKSADSAECARAMQLSDWDWDRRWMGEWVDARIEQWTGGWLE